MRIPVLIESLPDQTYRATQAAWAVSAEGATSEEALGRLRSELKRRIASGDQMISMEVDEAPADSGHPLARFAGCMKDEPLYEEWQRAVAEYRTQCDQN